MTTIKTHAKTIAIVVTTIIALFAGLTRWGDYQAKVATLPASAVACDAFGRAEREMDLNGRWDEGDVSEGLSIPFARASHNLRRAVTTVETQYWADAHNHNHATNPALATANLRAVFHACSEDGLLPK